MADLQILIGTDISSSIERIKTDLTTKIKPALDGHLKISIGIDAKSIEKQINDINVKAAKVKQPKVSVVNEDAVKKVGQQVEILQSRIERAKVSWSKMLGDPEIMSQVNSIQAALKDVGGDPKKYQDLNRQWQLLSNNIAVAELNTKSFGAQISQTFSRLSAYLVNVALIGTVTKALRDAAKSTLELNKSMTDLQVVTGWNNTQAKESVMLYNEYAKALGVTTQAVMEGADSWLRQGKAIEETNQLIQTSTMFARVAQLETAESTELLTAALNGYNLEASAAMGITDMFTAVDLEAATSAKELATAYQYVSASAGQVGVSQEKLTALLAVGSEQTRLAAEQIGNAWRTLISRMSNVKVGKFIDDETGEDLNDVLKVLGKLEIEVINSQGVWRDFGDIFDEIGAKWKTFDQTQQNALATALAGTRQTNIFRATMESYADVLKYTETAENSAGTTLEKFGVITDSIDYKINNFKESLVGMWQGLIDSEAVKGVIDLGTGVVSVFDKIVNTPVVGTIVGITTATLALGSALKVVKDTGAWKNISGFFKDIGRPKIQGFIGKLPHSTSLHSVRCVA